MNIKAYLAEKRAQVEDALHRFLPIAPETLQHHFEAMLYSLFAGGKRIRPILCLAAAESVLEVGKPSESVMRAACALECIHTYSLIHDDLPAMDNDELRRGKPTNHMIYGEAGAILAGDGLLTMAFELLSTPVVDGDAAERQLRVIRLISRAAGPEGMVGGQVLDLDCEGREIPFGTLREIHGRKTGALITASVQAGAVLGFADEQRFTALTEYGNNIGLAFQIVDDLLNVEGDPVKLGKATGSDAERGKATYPAFFGLKETRRAAAQAVDDALTALTGFDRRAEPLRGVARYIMHRSR